jgi:low affinity Fe/Cu permease
LRERAGNTRFGKVESSSARSGWASILSDGFRRFAVAASGALGTHWAFLTAVVLVVGWAATGPLFHFGEQWQLVINTSTTIITFLMVFIIQTTQNRDARAIHLKLDELIRCGKGRNVFADLESATDQELDAFQREFASLRQRGVARGSALEQAHQIARKPNNDANSHK